MLALALLALAERLRLLQPRAADVHADLDVRLPAAPAATESGRAPGRAWPCLGYGDGVCDGLKGGGPVLEGQPATVGLGMDAGLHGLEHLFRLADELVQLKELQEQVQAQAEGRLERIVGDDSVLFEERQQIRSVREHGADLISAVPQLAAADILPYLAGERVELRLLERVERLHALRHVNTARAGVVPPVSYHHIEQPL